MRAFARGGKGVRETTRPDMLLELSLTGLYYFLWSLLMLVGICTIARVLEQTRDDVIDVLRVIRSIHTQAMREDHVSTATLAVPGDHAGTARP